MEKLILIWMANAHGSVLLLAIRILWAMSWVFRVDFVQFEKYMAGSS